MKIFITIKLTRQRQITVYDRRQGQQKRTVKRQPRMKLQKKKNNQKVSCETEKIIKMKKKMDDEKHKLLQTGSEDAVDGRRGDKGGGDYYHHVNLRPPPRVIETRER